MSNPTPPTKICESCTDLVNVYYLIADTVGFEYIWCHQCSDNLKPGLAIMANAQELHKTDYFNT